MNLKMQWFQRAMKAKREEAAKVKAYYESEKGKKDLALVRKKYTECIDRQDQIKKQLPF